jgi:hexokinase
MKISLDLNVTTQTARVYKTEEKLDTVRAEITAKGTYQNLAALGDLITATARATCPISVCILQAHIDYWNGSATLTIDAEGVDSNAIPTATKVLKDALARCSIPV